MNNIKYLHVIRGFAAFMVVLAHAKWPFWIGGTAFMANRSFSALPVTEKAGLLQALASSNGTSMVIVFYVLSGFVVSYSYQKNRWTYKQFLVNRALRIYIPYLASAIVAGFFLWIAFKLASPVFENPIKDYHARVAVAKNEGLTVINFLKTLVFAKTERINYFGFNYVYWSLLYESIFYLLFPFILRWYKIILLASAIIYPLHFVYNPMPEINYWWFYFTEFLLYFTAAVALFSYLKGKEISYLKSQFLFRKNILLSILVLSFVIVLSGVSERLKDFSFSAAAIFGLASIVLIWLYSLKTNFITKALLYLGTISYSLYLVHVPILLLLYALFYNLFGWAVYSSPWVYWVVLIFVIPAAGLFYRIFEVASFSLINAQKRKLHKPQDDPDFAIKGTD